MAERWGLGYIYKASRWEGLIHWLNWIVNQNLEETQKADISKSNPTVEKSSACRKITLANVLWYLSSPEALNQLLSIHPSFRSFSKETLLSLTPTPPSINNKSWSIEFTQISGYTSISNSCNSAVSKACLQQNALNLIEGDKLTKSNKFFSLKARRSFLLSRVISFIQSECPSSRVRNRKPYFEQFSKKFVFLLLSVFRMPCRSPINARSLLCCYCYICLKS